MPQKNDMEYLESLVRKINSHISPVGAEFFSKEPKLGVFSECEGVKIADNALTLKPIDERKIAAVTEGLLEILRKNFDKELVKGILEQADRELKSKEDAKKPMKAGISGMDLLIKGIPQSLNVLVYGKVGTGKTTILKSFIREGIRENQPCVAVLTDEPRERFIEVFREGAEKHEKNGLMRYVDVYSWRLEGVDINPLVHMAGSPSDLNEISYCIDEAIQKLGQESEQKRFVFDSLTQLFLHNEASSVFKLIEKITSKLSANNYTSLFILDEGITDEKVVNTLNYLTNGTILTRRMHTKLGREERQIRVDRMEGMEHGLNWKRFVITKDGMVIRK